MMLQDAMAVRMFGKVIGRKTGLSVSRLPLKLPDRNLYSIPTAFRTESDVV